MSKPQNSSPLQIDVVSDVVCPWCFIGKSRLQKAIALKPEIPVAVRWRPYFLNDWIPRQGISREEYLTTKFGSVERYEGIAQRVTAAAAAEGLTYDSGKIKRQPNTLDCHRLILWSAATGDPARMKQRLMDLYFTEGADLTDKATLLRAALDCGMDGKTVADLLDSDTDVERITREANSAKESGIEGVPCFIFGGRLAVSGAQAPEYLAGRHRTRGKRARSRGDAGRRRRIGGKDNNRPADFLLGRRGGRGKRNEAAQNRRRTLETLLRLFPVVEEHDLHVGPHARGRSLLADIGDQALRIGEDVVAEGEHRALRPGLDLLDIGPPAQRLDGHDLEQVLDLLRQRPEAVDQFGAEGVDLALVLEVGKPAVEREPHRQVGDIVLGDQHRRADGDLRRPAVGDRLADAGLQARAPPLPASAGRARSRPP